MWRIPLALLLLSYASAFSLRASRTCGAARNQHSASAWQRGSGSAAGFHDSASGFYSVERQLPCQSRTSQLLRLLGGGGEGQSFGKTQEIRFQPASDLFCAVLPPPPLRLRGGLKLLTHNLLSSPVEGIEVGGRTSFLMLEFAGGALLLRKAF